MSIRKRGGKKRRGKFEKSWRVVVVVVSNNLEGAWSGLVLVGPATWTAAEPPHDCSPSSSSSFSSILLVFLRSLKMVRLIDYITHYTTHLPTGIQGPQKNGSSAVKVGLAIFLDFLADTHNTTWIMRKIKKYPLNFLPFSWQRRLG